MLVREAVATTTRFVKNAYWDLVFSINSLEVQRLSLDLAQRSLKENRARVEIGTMAPIDIVQAEAEVAQREEAVIIAEAEIQRAEDALRALIFGEHFVDEWNARLIPTDAATFTPMAVDLRAAVLGALDVRTDIVEAHQDPRGQRHHHPLPAQPAPARPHGGGGLRRHRHRRRSVRPRRPGFRARSSTPSPGRTPTSCAT